MKPNLKVPDLRVWLGRLAHVLAGLVIGSTVGLYLDQRFPTEVPLLAGTRQGKVDDQEALRVLRENYYDSKLDYGKLQQGSIQGMVASLGDPYSVYRSPDEYRQAQSSLQGECICVGITTTFQSARPGVGSLVAGSPGAQAGVRAAGVILKID